MIKNISGGGGGGGSFPSTDTRWMDEATVISGANLWLQPNASQLFYMRVSISPPAINNEFSLSFFLDSGTYDFKVLGNIWSDEGIIEWKLNDVVIVASQDWSGANTYNVLKTESGVVIPTPGVQVLKGKVIGTNGTDYYFRLIKLWFEKTG